MRRCGEDEQAQGIVAVVSSDYWGRASAVYYCEREQEPERAAAGGAEPDVVGIEVACAPSPEEVEAQRRFDEWSEVARAIYGHVTKHAKKIYRKFPGGRGHSKLRAWAHGAFAERYGCEPDGAWAGVREQKSPAVDRFMLMRTVPQCLPDLPEGALREGAELHAWEVDEAGAFLEFFGGVMPFACYRPTEGEEELFAHLRRALGIADEAEAPEAEPAAN